MCQRREYVSSVDRLYDQCFTKCLTHDGTTAKNRQKEGSFLECLGGEFDFLLIEAPPPRLFKKTKQTVATVDLNITHFSVELKVAIYSDTQTRSN
jgi:hypothetical protein